MTPNFIKEMNSVIELNRNFNRGYVNFDDTKLVLERSNDERVSYLLEVADMKMKFEMISIILSDFIEIRKRKLLLPYSEFLKFIKEINKVDSITEIQEELYFMSLEQIRTKYVPVGQSY